MLLLDINDIEITLTRDGDVLYAQPGVAMVERNRTLVGYEAMAQSRLHPRQTHNEFWQRLNADPVTPAGRSVANQADLVYSQLCAVRDATSPRDAAPVERTELIVAAPSPVTAAQLGLLLGIAAEAELDVGTVVDAGIAAAAGQMLSGNCRLVDVTMHRAFITQLDLDDDARTVSRGIVEEVPAAGFAALAEGWVDAVADQFVESTRFDPLRIAATEQQLFDQVLQGVDADSPEVHVAIEHDGVAREVHVSRRALAAKSAQRYGLLATAIGPPATLLITHRVRRLPGLAAVLQDAGHRIVALEADAVAQAVERQASVFASDADTGTGAKLVYSLPCRADGADATTRQRPHPTHLLCGALAVPLRDGIDARDHPANSSSAGGFRIQPDAAGFRVVATAAAPVRFNDEPLDFDRPALAGDRIVSGAEAFLLIAVVDD